MSTMIYRAWSFLQLYLSLKHSMAIAGVDRLPIIVVVLVKSVYWSLLKQVVFPGKRTYTGRVAERSCLTLDYRVCQHISHLSVEASFDEGCV